MLDYNYDLDDENNVLFHSKCNLSFSPVLILLGYCLNYIFMIYFWI